jgi:hypothetical protein
VQGSLKIQPSGDRRQELGVKIKTKRKKLPAPGVQGRAAFGLAG